MQGALWRIFDLWRVGFVRREIKCGVFWELLRLCQCRWVTFRGCKNGSFRLWSRKWWFYVKVHLHWKKHAVNLIFRPEKKVEFEFSPEKRWNFASIVSWSKNKMKTQFNSAKRSLARGKLFFTKEFSYKMHDNQTTPAKPCKSNRKSILKSFVIWIN